MDNTETVTQPEVTEVQTAQPEAVEPEAPAEGEVAPAVDPPKFKVKYNKEEKELEYDEAVPLIQKGMNYGKLETRLEELQKEKEKWKEYEETTSLLAKDIGVSESEVSKRLREQHFARQDKKRAESEGITVEQAKARRISETRASQLENENQTLKQQLTEKEQQDQLVELKRQEWVEFKEAFPNINELPEEVNEKWLHGTPPKQAYSDWQEKSELKRKLKEMEDRLGITETNQSNAEASTGALGAGADPDKPLTLDDVNKMTPTELAKNHDRIIKEVYGW